MKYVWWIIIVIVVVVGLISVVIFRPMNDRASMETSYTTSEATDTVSDIDTDTPEGTSVMMPEGRYVTYSPELVDDGYTSTILFFYAAWCPECRAYDTAIQSGEVPTGTQILKVTYDDAQDLRQQYGVTIQSTFVRVTSNGDKQVLWNGYGRDKSIDVIIENTK